jgi:periplasmic divalent cation tolerance protein
MAPFDRCRPLVSADNPNTESNMQSEFLLVVTTLTEREAAETLAAELVQKRLAACAQVEGPLHSVYWWQQQLETATEWKCSFKTPARLYRQLEARIREHHPYDTPEIIAFPIVTGSLDYLQWLTDETERMVT